MAKGNNGKQLFKPHSFGQLMLLPPSLDELIPKGHAVRVVHQVIEKIDIQPLLAQYKGGGTTSYHPKLLLKVLVYAYLSNIYSSRKIEAALMENIHFMWLAGMSRPDHNTINRFRSERLKEALKQVFKQVVLLLAEEGLVDIKEIYVDGTKVEANANKYTFVWGKNIKNNKEKIKQQLNDLWEYAQQVAADELDEDASPTEYQTIDAEKVQKTIDSIDKALKDKPINKKVKQKLSYAKKKWPENLKKYQEQEETLQGRNSYSKTDPGATFMRMKDDHMLNGQLKPGYNWQISTNQQIILNYSLHTNAADTTTLIPHLEQYAALYGHYPNVTVSDAGYGSEENYQYAEDNGIEAYLKYNTFHKEQKQKQPDPFAPESLYYNPDKDCYYCPMGQPMHKTGVQTRKTRNGYTQTLHNYEAINCEGCPLRSLCHQAKGNRAIQINHTLNRLKAKARQKLLSEEGINHRKKRPVEVESVFGNLKNNHGFTRHMLRGLPKVEIEVGLLAIAHNLRKLAA